MEIMLFFVKVTILPIFAKKNEKDSEMRMINNILSHKKYISLSCNFASRRRECYWTTRLTTPAVFK